MKSFEREKQLNNSSKKYYFILGEKIKEEKQSNYKTQVQMKRNEQMRLNLKKKDKNRYIENSLNLKLSESLRSE